MRRKKAPQFSWCSHPQPAAAAAVSKKRKEAFYARPPPVSFTQICNQKSLIGTGNPVLTSKFFLLF
jgi:hypothetical protein